MNWKYCFLASSAYLDEIQATSYKPSTISSKKSTLLFRLLIMFSGESDDVNWGRPYFNGLRSCNLLIIETIVDLQSFSKDHLFGSLVKLVDDNKAFVAVGSLINSHWMTLENFDRSWFTNVRLVSASFKTSALTTIFSSGWKTSMRDFSRKGSGWNWRVCAK